VNLAGQWQSGEWLITRHSAFLAHGPGQGLIHRKFMQDLLRSHSELEVHSGRQDGGEPIYSGKQLQIATSFTSRH